MQEVIVPIVGVTAWTIIWEWASGCAIHSVNSISVNLTGAATVTVGYHWALSGPRRSVPLCQVLADRGHVCVLVHDCGHDSGPPLCHLLPSASVPWRQNVALEHAHHGGLGPGPGTQFTTGVKGQVIMRILKYRWQVIASYIWGILGMIVGYTWADKGLCYMMEWYWPKKIDDSILYLGLTMDIVMLISQLAVIGVHFLAGWSVTGRVWVLGPIYWAMGP